MYEVKDGRRTLKFDGTLLAYSTSYREGSPRWVEFSLYRTTGHSYVLARSGMTNIYHTTGCSVAQRNGLPPVPAEALRASITPCGLCKPTMGQEMYAVEVPRHWAQVSDTAEAVVDALHKYDDSGARYLTGVAQRLLEEASEVDSDIDAAYRVETIY